MFSSQIAPVCLPPILFLLLCVIFFVTFWEIFGLIFIRLLIDALYIALFSYGFIAVSVLLFYIFSFRFCWCVESFDICQFCFRYICSLQSCHLNFWCQIFVLLNGSIEPFTAFFPCVAASLNMFLLFVISTYKKLNEVTYSIIQFSNVNIV